MALRQDFEYRVSLLNNVGVQELTPRLIHLLRWINEQPSVKKMLDDLKATSPLTPLINSADANRYKKAAGSAASPEAIAVIGLYMMEACTWATGGTSYTPIYQIANLYGIQAGPGYHQAEHFADAAMKRYIEPFLNFVRRQMPEENSPTKEIPMPIAKQFTLSVFISHSSKDEKLAAGLVDLLRSALNIPASEIRCTSVNGYRLPIGAETENQLREEVHQAKTFIGLITPSSIASAYVMFELGARWGAKLHLAPLLGNGADSSYLRGPLGSLNALNCEDVAQVHQLIDDLAHALGLSNRTPPAAYQRYVDELVETSKTARPTAREAPAGSGAKLGGKSKNALRFLCDRNGVVTIQELAAQLGCSSSEAQFICDGLNSMNLISFTSMSNIDPRWEALGENTGYEISSEGRRLCFDRAI